VLLRPIARPMFASWYVVEGLDALRHPAVHAVRARDSLAALEARARRWTSDTGSPWPAATDLSDQTLRRVVRVHAAAMLGVAGLLALGRAPRAHAAILAALTLPVVVANAPRGRALDNPPAAEPTERSARRRRFWTAVSMLGGALLAASDYEGRPGPRWRVRDAHARHVAVQQGIREATATA